MMSVMIGFRVVCGLVWLNITCMLDKGSRQHKYIIMIVIYSVWVLLLPVYYPKTYFTDS
jgi:hypothetical protein